MNTLRYLALLIILLGSFATFSSAQQNTANCPGCLKDQTPLTARHGHTSENPPRQIVKVGMLLGTGPGSWANPDGTANADVRNAAGNAREKWNNATDTSSSPGETKKIPYYFESAVTGEAYANVDIIVVKEPKYKSDGVTENPIAHMETGGSPPYKLFIREDMPGSTTPEGLASLIAHELGHRIGLANAYGDTTTTGPGTGTGCDQATSIMRDMTVDPATGKNVAMVPNVQERDVYMVNKQFNPATRNQCQKNDPKDDFSSCDVVACDGGGGDDPCGGDPNCGDPCGGDPCCGDPNCGNGGWSYCITYTETVCDNDCWVINAYTRQCEYWHSSCSTHTWTECY